jgi:hypothetical protein
MAKRNMNSDQGGKGRRGEKSAAVRELLGKNLHAPVKEIVASLSKQGLAVNPNLVYLIKGKMKAQRNWKRRSQAVQAGRNAGLAHPVELVRRVKDLALAAGGIQYLKQLVDVLAE